MDRRPAAHEKPRPCDFCDIDAFRAANLSIENALCIYASGDPYDRSEVLPGSGIIVPLAHRETPFDLTPEEWAATHELLVRVKDAVDDRWSPDGYTLIWNCYPTGGQEILHVHLHVIPQFADEPYAGRGGRWHIKQPENRRPDPSREGGGFAVDDHDGSGR